MCPDVLRKKITAAIADWIIRDCRPNSVTKEHGFRNMLHIATGCSQYTQPCSATVTHIIQSHYDTEKRNVQTKLASANGVARTVDFWTSIQNIRCSTIVLQCYRRQAIPMKQEKFDLP